LSDAKIYMSGPMFNCTEQEVFGWRLEAKKLLGTHNCVDPSDRWHLYENDLSLVEGWKIVNGDLSDIDRCGGLLVNGWRAGWGTAMEVRYAYDKRKLVASVVNGPVSVWLKCHSDYIASTVAEAAHWLAVQLRLKGTVWDEA
jgi:nucleoside 2-deoxyribosyltransferase